MKEEGLLFSHDEQHASLHEPLAGRPCLLSIAAKNSPKVPFQKSPRAGDFTLARPSASLKFPRTCVRSNTVFLSLPTSLHPCWCFRLAPPPVFFERSCLSQAWL